MKVLQKLPTMTRVVPASLLLLVCDGGSVYETDPIQQSPETGKNLLTGTPR